MLKSHLIKESAAVHYISRMSEKLRDAIADGAWQTSQRGNGAGGVHSRHNAHRLYPSHQPVKSEAKPKKCEGKVTVRMVSPAQATVEQARSEAKQLKEQERSTKKRRSIQTPVKPRKKVNIGVPFLRMAQGTLNSPSGSENKPDEIHTKPHDFVLEPRHTVTNQELQ